MTVFSLSTHRAEAWRRLRNAAWFVLLPAAAITSPLANGAPAGQVSNSSATVSTANPVARVSAEHIETVTVSEDEKVTPDSTVTVGFRLTPEPGWHIYWRNPGDSGLPTRISWELPPGVSAGEIQWPYPERADFGSLANYGYGSTTMLLVPLHLDHSLQPGTTLKLHAQARWLICKDLCIPESAQYDLTVPVAAQRQAAADWAAEFASARSKLPLAMPATWSAHFAVDVKTAPPPAASGPDAVPGPPQGTVSVSLSGTNLPASARLSFFPAEKNLVHHAAPQRIAREGDVIRISQALSPAYSQSPDNLDGVLVATTPDSILAYDIHAAPGTVMPVADNAAPNTASAPTLSLFSALLYALLGGLILNLMPCVFPVLSLKALTLAQAGGQAAAHRQRDALAYTAGVLLSFVGIAGLLIALRATGSAFGWGFQLQSPPFVAVLAELMFALGLSMSGLAMFGTRLMGLGQQLTERGGALGAFFTGVLATVVASPCSAPFMGAALGFALLQPAPLALTIFAALGFGMALPFLLIGFVPGFARLLPRPGAWMETFKQFLAFPLYLTSVWLIWVLARQVGANGAALVLLGLVLISFALWVSQHGQLRSEPSRITPWLAGIALAAALALTAAPAIRNASASAPTATTASADTTSTVAQPYSDAKLDELRAAHRTIFVNFTADWCLSCKVNEHGALQADRVREAFAAHQVAWLEGDWTRYDPAITHILEKFGRSGVPLYLVYRDGAAEPQVLPQILTPDLLIEAVNGPAANNGSTDVTQSTGAKP